MSTLTFPNVGDTVRVRLIGDRLGTMTISGPCENANNGRWHCITHNQTFHNNFDKDTHLGKGTHQMVWVCFEHGLEVDPNWHK